MRFIMTVIGRLLLVMFLNLLVLSSGCVPENKIKKCTFKTYDEQFQELINKCNNYAEYKYKRVRVFYEIGLAEQAQLLASLTEELILFVERELNLQLNVSELTLFLFHAKEKYPIPEERNDFSGTGFHNGQKTLISLFIPANADLESILEKNAYIYPAALFHEMVEAKLTSRIQVNFSYTKDDIESMRLTRWFREGFSNYAGYISFHHLLSKIDISDQSNKTLFYNGLEKYPFSQLSKINEHLFKWKQIHLKNDLDYYYASFGLFLLIEEKYGTEAVSEIGKNIDKLKGADGRDLIALCNKVIGEDIVEIVRSFQFPDLGMSIEALFPVDNMEVPYGISVEKVSPNSIAQKAGIQEKDVIIKVGQQSVSTEFEFEYAIFRSLQQQHIPIEVWRKNHSDTLSFMLDIRR